MEKDGQSFISNKLMYFSPPVVDQQVCRASLVGHSQRLTDNMICAGTTEGHSDACQGDSGSALAIHHQGRYYTAAGIVSWGIACNARGSTGSTPGSGTTWTGSRRPWPTTTRKDDDDDPRSPPPLSCSNGFSHGGWCRGFGSRRFGRGEIIKVDISVGQVTSKI